MDDARNVRRRQVAVTVECHLEAGVLCDLFEHMVEETDTGCHLDRTVGIQVDVDTDSGLPGRSFHGGCSRVVEQGIDDPWPGVFMACVFFKHQSAHANALRKLEVCLSISNHRAAIQVQVVGSEKPGKQAAAWLSAVTIIRRQVRADEHFVERNSLRRKQGQHVLLALLIQMLRKGVSPETVLIADDDEVETLVAQRLQGRDDIVDQRYFIEGIDLKVIGLADERPVSVEEQHFPGHAIHRDIAVNRAADRFHRLYRR